ncbi:tRNA pseudouridine(38-40) synthase, variant [Aphanomyces invadans]|uniref:tRNA pseudouridine(38-40) synthase, variant n=1 Tax=Aphanomyces invadans TaxID=157072 RepID=A0A024UVB7_9STRA|nr:tRNA pseudouridine(38-40) synthase, variant [Aphanomyces invadans]ETW09598.1 tRNA pseudouridine(38-40) synthase, variant [Aphanomyces invadans]|eukprot:XP_008861009.1 tRNA pseudouridine(38-40) synthase, variant [Aphanomyces invadans]
MKRSTTGAINFPPRSTLGRTLRNSTQRTPLISVVQPPRNAMASCLRTAERTTRACKCTYMHASYCLCDCCGHTPCHSNIGVKTIEAELERALYEAGGIARCNYGMIQKIGWNRAARTDKGVHAAGQLVSMKLCIEDGKLNEFRNNVNSFLPPDIQVLDIVAVTKNFNSKNSCDRRTYEYLTPTFVFAPKGVMTDKPATASGQWTAATYDEFNSIKVDPEAWAMQKEFRLDATALAKLRETLAIFVGTHNFHNYTSKLPPYSPQCNRYILSFEADDPFVKNGTEWIRLRVVGQSFLLHHIRKMIGTTMDVLRGSTPATTIKTAFEQTKMDLPKAPSAGLYLAKAHFEVYNDKNENHRPSLAFDEPDQLDRIEAFKEAFIFPEIMEREEQDAVFPLWLLQLDAIPFTYTTCPYDEWRTKKDDETSRKGQYSRGDSDDEQNENDDE